jgi:membrane fusion protein (multidrug efflux system)
MKKIILFSLLIFTAAACKQEQDKMAELKEAKKELKKLQEKISQLEEEIASSDTLSSSIANGKAVLVSTLEIEKAEFKHAIEVRGSVESRRNVMIGAETGGRINNIHVSEGQEVTKGQVLVTLDADLIRNNISTLKTQLELATAVFERQKRLWDQNIGTEIQYLEAKNRKETLEAQLATANSQLAQAVVRAPFSGIVDQIPSREGELTQAGMPLLRLLNPGQMYIKSDVSEKYIGRFAAGDNVNIYFPSQKEKVNSTVTSVSHVINPENRTFSVEVALPEVDFPIRPNQVTVVNLQDYKNNDAIAVPTKVIRKDQSGSYVYTLGKENGSFIAKKTNVIPGVSFNNQTEILEGLKEGEQVIVKGINELTDGAHVQLATRTAASEQLAIENN